MHVYMYTYNTQFLLGKHVIQTNPSKFDERLFSDIHMCGLRLRQRREIQDFMKFWGRERGRDRDRQRQETDRDRELLTQTRGIMSNKYQPLLLLQCVTWHSAVSRLPEHRHWILRRHWIIPNVCGPEVLRQTERPEEVPTSGRFHSVTQSLYWGCIVSTGQSVAQVSLWLRSVYGSGQSVAQVSLWLRSVCGSGQSVAQVSLWLRFKRFLTSWQSSP